MKNENVELQLRELNAHLRNYFTWMGLPGYNEPAPFASPSAEHCAPVPDKGAVSAGGEAPACAVCGGVFHAVEDCETLANLRRWKQWGRTEALPVLSECFLNPRALEARDKAPKP